MIRVEAKSDKRLTGRYLYLVQRKLDDIRVSVKMRQRRYQRFIIL